MRLGNRQFGARIEIVFVLRDGGGTAPNRAIAAMILKLIPGLR